MLNRSFWNSHRVFLTGHAGFEERWLYLWLEVLGANVIGYALGPPTQPSCASRTCCWRQTRPPEPGAFSGSVFSEEYARRLD
jgi:hypothetical protein